LASLQPLTCKRREAENSSRLLTVRSIASSPPQLIMTARTQHELELVKYAFDLLGILMIFK
jgi:hypothetical protein